MSRLIIRKLEVAFILWFAASTMVACRASVGIVRKGIFQSQAAKALEPSERAVMEQPDWHQGLLKSGINVDLEDWWFSSRSSKEYPGLVKPARIEVSPGKHRFIFWGGNSWWQCYFELTMLPGHVYKPTWFSGKCGDCGQGPCLLEVIDTFPDGKRLTLTVSCCGYPRCK